jgi:hypothetical protein
MVQIFVAFSEKLNIIEIVADGCQLFWNVP